MTTSSMRPSILKAFILVGVFAVPFVSHAQWVPDAALCLTGQPNTSYSFTYVGDPAYPTVNDPTRNMDFWDGGSVWTNRNATTRSFTTTYSWSTPGTYLIRGLGPTSSFTGGPSCGCSGGGSPGYGTIYGPDGQSDHRWGDPAYCKVVITAAVAPTVTLTATPSTITQGSSSNLTWTSSNATSCVGTNFSTANATSNSSGVGVTPANTTTYSIQCTGAGGSASATATVTVNPLQPNLTAAVGSAVTATVGQAATFNGTTYNAAGAGTASAGFNDLFIFYNANQSSWQGFDYVSSNPSIAAGGSSARATSHTFSSPGTYYYQLCADWNGGVTESNEGDNCSALQTITVYPASPTNLTYACNAGGTAVTLSWTASSGATSYNPRIWVPSASYCPTSAGWQIWSDGQTCYPNPDTWGSTSIVNFPITPSTSYGWWVHSAYSGGVNWADSASGPAFNCSGAADLTPVSLTPSTVVAGQSTTFTATLQNGGTAATPNFSSTIYVCAQGDTTCINNPMARANTTIWSKILAFFRPIAEAATSIKITLTGSPLAAGTSGTQSGSNTFASAGTYQARLCADLPLNEVDEGATGENNNCANWQVLVVCPSGNTIDSSGNCVPPATPAPTCTLTTDATSVPTTIRWSSTNATSCTGGGYSTGNSTSGNTGISVAGTYTLSCTGTGGNCSAQTTVSGATCSGPATVDIQANGSDGPIRVVQGTNATISWTATNVPSSVSSCSVTGTDGYSQSITPSGAPTCSINPGSVVRQINTQTTYTITCGSASDSVLVNVVPEFDNF